MSTRSVAESIKSIFANEAKALSSPGSEVNALLVQTPDGGYTVSLEVYKTASDTETDLVVTVAEVEGGIEIEAMITGSEGGLLADIGSITTGESSLSFVVDAICRAGIERLVGVVLPASAA